MNYVLVIECPLLVIFASEIVQVGEDDQPWCLNVQQYAADVPNCKHCSLVNVSVKVKTTNPTAHIENPVNVIQVLGNGRQAR